MKIRARNKIWFVEPGATIIASSSSSSVVLTDDNREKRVLGRYANNERAKEVLEDLWNAITSGKDCFEMPEI